MSRPRSRSPRYRRFPWEEPDFDPHNVVAELDGNRLHRDVPEELREYFSEDRYSEGHRRSPSFSEDCQFGRRRHPGQEEFSHRRISPHHDAMRYEDRRPSPKRDRGRGVNRRRGGFRPHFQSFENRVKAPHSPARLQRERLSQTPGPHSNLQQRESGMGWRREEQGRGRGKFRDLSPGMRSDEQRAGSDREKGRRSTQGPNRCRQRENPHHDRSLPFKRQRREMDDTNHPGYRDEEDFGGQGYSVDSPRDGFGGNTRGNVPCGAARQSGPVVSERNHGITNGRELPRWEKFGDHRDHGPGFGRQRSPRPVGSFQEHFRILNRKLDEREDARVHHFQDNVRDLDYTESRRSPVPQDRPNPMRYGNRGGRVNHRGRDISRPMRNKYNHNRGGRGGHPRTQPRLQQSSQGYQDLPDEEQRSGYQPFREDYKNPVEDENNWVEDRSQQWEHDKPGSLDRHPDPDPKMPRQRQRAWNDQKSKSMTVVTEETLTIKVDMSRPVQQNSPLCYSSDRQLSLDLVNVGRQRLDFLPMLEHSGTYRETAMHTGTFAQEIITLVHLVKDQYFRDDGVTLNERFSAPQQSGYTQEEMEELTLDKRFSSNRGFSLNTDSLLDDDEPLFFRLGLTQGLSQQPVRGPGDLRHDLERRRQEKLEGVKVTIPGSNVSQRRLASVSEPDLEYSDRMEMDDGEFFDWPEETNRRREGKLGPRRGTPNRPNTGFQRRNNRFTNQRQNFHSGPPGPSW